MTRLLLLALALSLAPPALAQDLPLVPANDPNAKGRSVTVSTQGVDITTADFAAAILDGSTYPMSASYMGVPALLECRTLDRRADGTVVVYQRTGGNALVSSRHYVIALKVAERSDTRVKVVWNLVQHTQVNGRFEGPYATALNAHPEAVYTPYNTGSWVYDRAAGTVTYSARSDPGGELPGWMVSEGAVMAFPLELLRVKWGIEP